MVTKTLTNNNFYTYRVTWSEEDKEYIGLCAEFPGISWLADSQDKALHGIVNLVSEILLDMETNNEKIPEPLSVKKFSGKLVVRIPSDIHRKLAIQAAESKVSLNRFISAKLASD
jgi:predicted HicB family RNase H-like nuclease